MLAQFPHNSDTLWWKFRFGKHGRCSLQVAASHASKPKWALKPLYCVLFPLEVIGGVLRYDRRYYGLRACCTARPEFEVPLFEACRAELVNLVGEQGFRAIEEHYATYYAAK